MATEAYERRCIRGVVDVNREKRVSGGKMRPIERVYYVCKLVCGHMGEKLKNHNSVAPPTRMVCMECREELDSMG